MCIEKIDKLIKAAVLSVFSSRIIKNTRISSPAEKGKFIVVQFMLDLSRYSPVSCTVYYNQLGSIVVFKWGKKATKTKEGFSVQKNYITIWRNYYNENQNDAGSNLECKKSKKKKVLV